MTITTESPRSVCCGAYPTEALVAGTATCPTCNRFAEFVVTDTSPNITEQRIRNYARQHGIPRHQALTELRARQANRNKS